MNKDKMIMPELVHNDEFDIDIKPYLTLGEVELIATEMMKAKNWCDQQIIFHQFLLQCCVNEPEVFEGMEYEALKHSGVYKVIEDSISNIGDVISYIQHQTSINKEVGEFLQEMIKLATKAEKKIPKQKELKEAFKIFEELKDKDV